MEIPDGRNERVLGWQDDGWYYTIHTSRPSNQDGLVLTVLRHQKSTEHADNNGFHQQYLTDEGWVDYKGFDLLRSTLAFPGNCLIDTDKIDEQVLDMMERALRASSAS